MIKRNQSRHEFNRFELKYLVTLQQAAHFKSVLRSYLIPDENGNDNGSYMLSSLYYDSADLRCYWEKEYGLEHRRKLRIRHYETGGPFHEGTPVFVEIKQRLDRASLKRRVRLSYGDALRLCNDRQIPEHAPEDKEVIEEIYAYTWQYNLLPTSIVRYRRQAFIGTMYDPGLRVTFDTELAFEVNQLHLHERPACLPILPANQVVMEIKVDNRLPYWLTDLIAAKNLQVVRISKYCRSIDAASKMSVVQRRRLIAEDSQEVLSSSYIYFDTLKQKMGIPK